MLRRTSFFCNMVKGDMQTAGWGGERSSPDPAYLFLVASGLRLIFLLLSLLFFGGSGLACMCLP